MALTLKNPNVELLVDEVTRLTGESKTEAIRRALLERRDRLRSSQGPLPRRELRRFLETHVWPQLAADVRGRPVTKEEEEVYLGLGPGGV
jgi:antitoxin VapB